MGNYRELVAWQRARALAGAVYVATEHFPLRERFGLAAQMRRAGISIVSNIAEGAGRGSDREFHRFLQIARGSLGELQTQITIAADLELIADDRARQLTQAAADTARVLHGLLRVYQHAAHPKTHDSRPTTID
jgi:S23 ribosomal protein.